MRSISGRPPPKRFRQVGASFIQTGEAQILPHTREGMRGPESLLPILRAQRMMKLIKVRIAGIHLDNAENQRIVIQTLGGSRIIAADSLIEFLQLQ